MADETYCYLSHACLVASSSPRDPGDHSASEEQPTKDYKHIWLVVSTPLKNIRQWEGLSHILWKIKKVPNHQPELQTLRLISFCTVHGWKRAPSQARACMGASKNWGYNNTTIRLPFKYADRSRPRTKTCLLRITWQTNPIHNYHDWGWFNNHPYTWWLGAGHPQDNDSSGCSTWLLGTCPPRCLELSAAVAEPPDATRWRTKCGWEAWPRRSCNAVGNYG